MTTKQKIKCEFTNEQLRDISFAVLMYMSHIEKTSKIDYEQNPLIKNYTKIYSYIENLRERV